jgi:hypothetical protein
MQFLYNKIIQIYGVSQFFLLISLVVVLPSSSLVANVFDVGKQGRMFQRQELVDKLEVRIEIFTFFHLKQMVPDHSQRTTNFFQAGSHVVSFAVNHQLKQINVKEPFYSW